MCGIAGILHFDNVPVERNTLQQMTNAIAHRGPDGEGIWINQNIGLGHRRLAIRDLSKAGQQPIFAQHNSIAVVYNGEIYNYDALRKKIESEINYHFHSSCDSELIPIGWFLWREKLFSYLQGMFALGIWDSNTDTLILARDGIGIKPLYYAHYGQALFFCSEVKGILATKKIPIEINKAAFHTYLAAGYTNPDDSLVSHIQQVSPGTFLKISSQGNKSLHRYWQPTRSSQTYTLTDAAEELEVLMKDVVKQTLVSDVPIGLLQSSGIDSTILSLLTSKELNNYTLQFHQKSYDESDLSRQIAALTQHPWHSITMDQSSVSDDFHAIAYHVDGQLADSSCLAYFNLSRAVRKKVKVALSGDGADEIFAGYSTYKASRLAQFISPILPSKMAQIAGNCLAKKFAKDESRLPWHEFCKRFLWGIAASRVPHAEWRRLIPPHLISDLYGNDLKILLNENALKHYENAVKNATGTIFDKCLLADQLVYLPGDMLAKVDRMSMAHGLEIRVPFLDRRIIEFANQLPTHLLISANPFKNASKRVLRHLLSRNNFPPKVRHGRKKGFNVPIARLLRTDLKNVGIDILSNNTDLFSPLLNPDQVRKLWDDHINGIFNHSYVIWALLIYGSWRKTL